MSDYENYYTANDPNAPRDASPLCTPSRPCITGTPARYPQQQRGGIHPVIVFAGVVGLALAVGQVAWEIDPAAMEIPARVTGEVLIPAAFLLALAMGVVFIMTRLGHGADAREMERQYRAAKQDGWNTQQTYRAQPPQEWQPPARVEQEPRKREKPQHLDPVVYRSKPIHIPPAREPGRETHEQAAERYVETIWERMNADADRNLYQ